LTGNRAYIEQMLWQSLKLKKYFCICRTWLKTTQSNQNLIRWNDLST
jgi:hypothetical protein